MEEEPHAKTEEPAAKKGGKSKEMVIVNPDIVILGADDLDDLLSIDLIGENIRLPQPPIETAGAAMVRPGERQQVVKERP